MKKKMKKLLAAGLCCALLLGCTACGEEVEKSGYQQALDAIEKADYETAYALLKESKDRRAPELLERFVFVPVKTTDKSSYGVDETCVYTYDERGNLLTFESTAPSGKISREYTYSGYKKTSYRSQSSAYSYGYTYTYDSAGNLVLERFLDRNGDWLGQTTYTYDEQGNCLSKETARMEEAQDLTPELESTNYCTYDTEGRLLCEESTYYYEEEIVESTRTYYTYEEDGSYCRVSTVNDGEPDLVRTGTIYYDAQGREVRGQWQFDTSEEPYIHYECRYNERGDIEYECRWEYGEAQVTTYVYDGQGNLLEEDTTDPQGEPFYMERNTYDERGNLLTNEAVWLQTNDWQKVTYTYDDQDRVLTRKRSSDSGWDDRTYTYDEQGNQTSETLDGGYFSYTVTYAYDEWGNPTSYFKYETHTDGGEYAYESTAQWGLQYYPEGVPAEVQTEIQNVPIP